MSRLELRALPQYEFGHGFELLLDNHCVAALSETTKGEFAIRVGREYFRISDTSVSGSYFELTDRDAKVVATAERPNPIAPRYEVRTQAGIYDLVPPSTFGAKRQILHQEKIVGLVDPDALDTRSTRVELPAEISWAEGTFMIWVVLRS